MTPDRGAFAHGLAEVRAAPLSRWLAGAFVLDDVRRWILLARPDAQGTIALAIT
jgi:hypothetical protein